MPKLLLLKGLPASGKSIKAKEIMEASGNFVRINYDLMREMLHFNKFSQIHEGITQSLARSLVRELLNTAHNVIIDNCNLSEKHRIIWSTIAKDCRATFEVIDLTDVPWMTCVARDRMRDHPVGDHVIMKMALQYNLADLGPKVVICDLDGTLCDTKWRVEHLRKQQKDWEKFYDGIPYDQPREDVLKIYLDYLNEGCTGVLVSGRPEKYRHVTEEWLNSFKIPRFVMLMRENHDLRQDDVVKKYILDTYLNKDDIVAVIDDRLRVLRMWQSEGLYTIDVGDGSEF